VIRPLVAAPAVALVLAPATAGASGARPPVALTAAPAHLRLAGSTRARVRVMNTGARRVVVDVSRAGFSLDLRGRPRIVSERRRRSAARWLTLRPRRFALRPHAAVSVVVASRVPRRAEPGDHDALVLLTTHPVANAHVAVRARMGVVVVVRAPGKVVRRLVLRELRTVHRARTRALDLVVENVGNVTDSIARARAVLLSQRTGRRLATLVAGGRELRPHTRGIVEFRLRSNVHGTVTARVMIAAAAGPPVLRRTYRIRL
jgi:hypothetical protein